MKYGVFLTPHAVACVHVAIGAHGSVQTLADVGQLMAELASPRADCLVLDPALLTAAAVTTVASSIAACPRDVVAFSSVTTLAMEGAVVLAQRTSARFVFRGTPNERFALERALLIAPDFELHSVLLTLIGAQLERLPSVIRDRLLSMFRGADGPRSADGLAAATALTRRSVDRYLADAGLTSVRRLVEASRVTSGYRAITTSRIPLRSVAAMLGYSNQRTMDAQFKTFLSETGAALRARPLSRAEAASRLAQAVQTRAIAAAEVQQPRHVAQRGATALKLIREESRPSNERRTASHKR